MKIEINLYESKYCAGCPCLHIDRQKDSVKIRCGLFKVELSEDVRHRVERLGICIEKDGE